MLTISSSTYSQIQDLIAEGYLKTEKHPTADLHIYNYTPKCQYDRYWNETTMICRGLILDGQEKIVARPFPKFFNMEEHQTPGMPPIPEEPFDVFEKMDGSLGILYWVDDEPHIATRGSFVSEQSQKATQLLHTKYKKTIPYLRKHKTQTWLFEIIYPENKIVVDYGEAQELVLLAIIDTETGTDEPLPDIGFPIVKSYDGIKDFESLKALNTPNAEGFVLRFKNGFRVKVKFAEYIRLHKLITQLSNVAIWEHLKAGQPFDEFLERVPDEFFDWVTKVKTELENQYLEIENQCRSVFKIFDTRKETALYFSQQQYPGILFSMLDGKDYADIIWKQIRPKYGRPFRQNIDM